jgi:hypothetical protein
MDSAIANAGRPAALNSWADIFCGVLFAPLSTFAALAEQTEHGAGNLDGAVLTVCLAFALDGLRGTNSDALGWAVWNVPSTLFAGAIMWVSLAGVLALLALCFHAPRTQVRAVFITTGWAFAPWILTAPIWCYRGVAGQGFVLLAMIPLIWVFFTQICAIKQTFKLSAWQTVALVFIVPCAYSLFSTLQFMQTVGVTLTSLSG